MDTSIRPFKTLEYQNMGTVISPLRQYSTIIRTHLSGHSRQ